MKDIIIFYATTLSNKLYKIGIFNPSCFDLGHSTDLVCNVSVSQGNGAVSTLTNGFTYKADLTPTVTAISKNRGEIIHIPQYVNPIFYLCLYPPKI